MIAVAAIGTSNSIINVTIIAIAVAAIGTSTVVFLKCIIVGYSCYHWGKQDLWQVVQNYNFFSFVGETKLTKKQKKVLCCWQNCKSRNDTKLVGKDKTYKLQNCYFTKLGQN